MGKIWENWLRRWYSYRERQLDAWEREIQREEIRLNLAEMELLEQERELDQWQGESWLH